MRRPKPHIEGEFQGDLLHPNCPDYAGERTILQGAEQELVLGPKMRMRGHLNLSKGGTQPPLG